MKTLFFLFICFLIINESYSSPGRESCPVSDNNSTDRVKIYDVYITSDTLSIVSNDDRLYHPFGLYDTWNDFEKNYIQKHWTNLQTDSLFIISSNRYIYTVRMSPNYMEFVQDVDNTGKIEIVRGMIYNNRIQLYDGIRVGMTKKEFLMPFIKDNVGYSKSVSESQRDFIKNASRYKDINIIEVMSALTGIWYYYFFSPDQILTFICIKTDYAL